MKPAIFVASEILVRWIAEHRADSRYVRWHHCFDAFCDRQVTRCCQHLTLHNTQTLLPQHASDSVQRHVNGRAHKNVIPILRQVSVHLEGTHEVVGRFAVHIVQLFLHVEYCPIRAWRKARVNWPSMWSIQMIHALHRYGNLKRPKGSETRSRSLFLRNAFAECWELPVVKKSEVTGARGEESEALNVFTLKYLDTHVGGLSQSLEISGGARAQRLRDLM